MPSTWPWYWWVTCWVPFPLGYSPANEVPELISGKPFPTGRKGFELLGDLITERNSIVHYRTSKYKEDRAARKKRREESEYFVKTVLNSVNTIEALAKDIDKLCPGEGMFAKWLE